MLWVCICSAAAPLPAAQAPTLGLLGTAVAPAVTPLVRPPFFVQNPLVLAGATAGLGAAAISSPGLVVPPIAGAADAIGQPSEYLLLKNMFDPSTEVSSLFQFISSVVLLLSLGVLFVFLRDFLPSNWRFALL